MATPHRPEPVLPIAGLLSPWLYPPELQESLEPIMGACVLRSPAWDFTATG